jgi:hypothetical protein
VPDRRPQRDVEPPKPVIPPVAPTLAVQGVVLSADQHFAIIQHGTPPKLEAVGEGATVDGWRVDSIDRNRVALSAGAATIEFQVGKKGAPAKPVTRPGAARRGFTNE